MTQDQAIAKLLLECKTREDTEQLIKDIFKQYEGKLYCGKGADFKENFFKDDKFYEILVKSCK